MIRICTVRLRKISGVIINMPYDDGTRKGIQFLLPDARTVLVAFNNKTGQMQFVLIDGDGDDMKENLGF